MSQVKSKDYHKRFAKIYLSEMKGNDPFETQEFKKNKSCVPNYLYKYHSVDDYTIDALENNYIYIAPADKMDDQFELALSVVKNYKFENMDEMENKYLYYFMRSMVGVSKEYDRMMTDLEGKYGKIIKKNDIEEYAEVRLKNKPEFLAITEQIKDIFSNQRFQEITEELFRILFNFKKTLGLYSLAEEANNQVMWSMYGRNYSGIVIEYDMTSVSNHFLRDLIIVRYSKKRKADPLKLYVDSVVAKLKNNEKDINYHLYKWVINVVATKNIEWAFQKEWRVISKKESHYESPKVSGIYLGKNISKEHKNKIIKFTQQKDIKLYEQFDDFENMKICFREMKEGL